LILLKYSNILPFYSRHDVSHGVLYHNLMDVGQLVVSYNSDLAILTVYLLSSHTYQGRLTGSHKDSSLGASCQLRFGPLRLSNKVGPKLNSLSLGTILLPSPFPKTNFISLTISNTTFP
jgi:hypothetical protein